jgi:stalled ribosome rescue protein Dom34
VPAALKRAAKEQEGASAKAISSQETVNSVKASRLLKQVAPKSGYRRGYAVAILAGIEESTASLWKVYSKVVKPESTLRLEVKRNDSKAVYNFHEAIVNALRPTLKEGVRTVVLASPPRTAYSREFIDHVSRHHAWLTHGASKVAFADITGSASTLPQVTALTRTPIFNELIQEATSEETVGLLELLESRLSSSQGDYAVLYSLDESEDAILYSHKGKLKPEHLLLTDKYLANSRQKGRLHRVMQIAANKKVKTRVVDAESPAGKRLTQLGGIVCLAKIT